MTGLGAPGAAVLDVRGVTREIALPDGDTLRILRGVDLRVGPGERVAILGRSGAGKTTLLNILGLIDRPTEGSISFRGADASSLGAGALARLRGRSVGFVFQQFNLLENRTAHANVVMPLLYGAPKQFWRRDRLASAMLEEVGLGDRADQLPRQLSGGEQQRVAIARALVRRPALILADEPTGALDVGTGQRVMRLLGRMSQETGAALVTITHDLFVAATADRVLLLQDGVLHERTIEEAELALREDALSRAEAEA
ncbi:ABC transporter ATP-binding protein [Gulosibacter sp. 10]|uniref:ABC transporter ATP-binding protein n=1 Tax=Gulosibacter sp. 10 TaxID=1255570 RepID=UPI00097E9275|nr:ABC transporter ATP-binding protein [Gulosibacter sp. 10]SJM71494.1 ABC transporter, ATP-binding protein [Gulosibacter sp. 10]